jgi:hypothetical protein
VIAESGHNKTYVEEVQDPVEVLSPGGDRTLIDLCVDESRERVPLTLFDDVPPDLGYGSAMKMSVSR